MTEVLLFKQGEMALKGLNRAVFERQFMQNIARRLKSCGEFKLSAMQSTVYAVPEGIADMDEALRRAERVFGAAAVTRAAVCPKNMDDICALAPEYLKEELSRAATFKVESKRADKRFPFQSPQISALTGAAILEAFPHLRVDVRAPEVLAVVEVRDQDAYIHTRARPGAGGIPIGMGGRAALLLSGGIDSPVAGYMMAKRGVMLEAVHFFSHPYTSERAKRKVLELAGILCDWCGQLAVNVVPFTHIQEEIRAKCPEDMFTIVMRRFMMRIAERIAENTGCGALITGESLGQVASQTMAAMAVTEQVCALPVLRPVVGMDKEEIVAIARKIGTFETSIQPYEDCCTVFTPRHPKTKPSIMDAEAAESALDIAALLDEAVAGVQTHRLEGAWNQ